MSNSTYYGPVGETAEQIFYERTFMNSGYLTGVGFGMQFILYLACIYKLWGGKNRTSYTYFLIGYLSLLNAMNTIWTGTSAYGLQITFIDNRNYPGGPWAFLGIEFSWASNVLSSASLIIGNILADLLLLWRCHVIFSAAPTRTATYFLIFPALLLLGSTSMAILFVISSASPSGFINSKITASFALPYFVLSLSLNIILTMMIVFRMYAHKLRGRAIFGTDYGRHYTSISAMFVESAALYAICSILMLVTYGLNNPIYQIWLGLCPAVQMASSYLIIYRVAEGSAWSNQTIANAEATAASDLAFGHSDTRIAAGASSSTQSIPLGKMSSHTHSEEPKKGSADNV